jgi:SAM-dependent MidA family methyltransferase
LNEAARKIESEINSRGIIPFSRFMELALYCPDYGYYEKDLYSPGRDGDFYTSVSVGSLFGELLAFQFDKWRRGAQSDCALEVVEAGAHDGSLAADVLNWFRQNRTQVFERMKYCILEPSARRQRAQAAKLNEFSGNLNWLPEIGSLPCPASRSAFRIIFSNEFLDALPVHRLGWDAARKNWFEWGVQISGGQFTWARMEPEPSTLIEATSQLSAAPLAEVLPDGSIMEICPAAVSWWRRAASCLGHGKLLTLDYGLTEEDLLVAERKNGTLRAYYKHRLSSDLLERPGDQDLTAHINFTGLQQAGEAAGLRTDAILTQERFLGEIAARAISEPSAFGNWLPHQARQLQTLTHPEIFGRRFRVLLQSAPG